jgi:phytoene synthase
VTALIDDSWENRLLTLAHEARHAVATLGQPPHVDAALLGQAYRYSAALTAQHSRSFYMASGFLTPPARESVRALYAFCRTADDIVDHGSDEASIRLEAWRKRALEPQPPEYDPVAMAWADTRARYHFPQRLIEQLLDGVARDLDHVGYRTFDELAIYCYGVASTVGLMSMQIIGYEDEAATACAVKLGVALQLTNILRDIAEDWRRGRLYLPLDELQAFSLSEQDVATGIIDQRWRVFMRFQIARTRAIYEEALPGIGLLARQGRLAVTAAATFYRAILADIEAHDYDVFSRRAYVGTWGKVRLLPWIWWRAKRY